MATKIGELTPSGVSNEIEVDLKKNEVKNINHPGLKWTVVYDDTPGMLLQGPTFVHSDGLRWCPCIEVMNLAEACGDPGDVVTLYVVPVSVPEAVIREARGETEESWAGLMEDMREQVEKDGDYSCFAWDLCTYGVNVPAWSTTVRPEGMEDTNYIVHGLEAIELARKNNLLVDSTLRVEMSPDEAEKYVRDRGDDDNVWVDLEPAQDKLTAEALAEAKDQALGLKGMFGFYMDRPVNRMGETGWDWLRRARAFPGQNIDHGGVAKNLPDPEHECPECQNGTIGLSEDGDELLCRGECGGVWEVPRCSDCFEYRLDCKEYHRNGSLEMEDLCQSCVEDYYRCPGYGGDECGGLVPIQPQSWEGVEWVQLNGEHYCPSCAAGVIDSDACPSTFEGGDHNADFIRSHVLDISATGRPDEDYWEEVKEWAIGMNDGEREQIEMMKLVAEPGTYLLACIWHEQFRHGYALYRRKDD